MTHMEELTDQMHRIEERLQFLNHKYNYDTEKMPIEERLEYENLQKNWDDLKWKRNGLKDGTMKNDLE